MGLSVLLKGMATVAVDEMPGKEFLLYLSGFPLFVVFL